MTMIFGPCSPREWNTAVVTLVWQRRRFVCGNCGERHLEAYPEVEGNLTFRLARQLVADMGVISVSAVARREENRLAQDNGPGFRLGRSGCWRSIEPRWVYRRLFCLSPAVVAGLF